MKKDPVYALADMIVKEIVEEVLSKNKKTQNHDLRKITQTKNQSNLRHY